MKKLKKARFRRIFSFHFLYVFHHCFFFFVFEAFHGEIFTECNLIICQSFRYEITKRIVHGRTSQLSRGTFYGSEKLGLFFILKIGSELPRLIIFGIIVMLGKVVTRNGMNRKIVAAWASGTVNRTRKVSRSKSGKGRGSGTCCRCCLAVSRPYVYSFCWERKRHGVLLHLLQWPKERALRRAIYSRSLFRLRKYSQLWTCSFEISSGQLYRIAFRDSKDFQWEASLRGSVWIPWSFIYMHISYVAKYLFVHYKSKPLWLEKNSKICSKLKKKSKVCPKF